MAYASSLTLLLKLIYVYKFTLPHNSLMRRKVEHTPFFQIFSSRRTRSYMHRSTVCNLIPHKVQRGFCDLKFFMRKFRKPNVLSFGDLHHLDNKRLWIVRGVMNEFKVFVFLMKLASPENLKFWSTIKPHM